MPCYRCGVRQTDPVRGPSPWKRGVRRGVQVLVCPDCQRTQDWTGDLDRCATCGSTLLVRILGDTHCRACGAAGDGAAGDGAGHGVLSAAMTTPAATPGPPLGGTTAVSQAATAALSPGGPTAADAPADLAGDVEAALDRLFGRAGT